MVVISPGDSLLYKNNTGTNNEKFSGKTCPREVPRVTGPRITQTIPEDFLLFVRLWA